MRIAVVIVVVSIVVCVAIGLWLAVHRQSEILSEVVTVCRTVDKKVLVERINISEVAWLEIPKVTEIRKCQEIEVHYEESCSIYTGCKEIVLSKKVLREWFENKTIIAPKPGAVYVNPPREYIIKVRVDLEKYKEIWVKENPWLARYVKKWVVKSTGGDPVILGGRTIVIEVPIPLGVDRYVRYPYMSNDTYIRYVAIPAIKALAKILNRTRLIDLEEILQLFTPWGYNVGNAYTGLWEKFIAEGGVCWQEARTAVAIAHYLGFKAVAMVLEDHEVGFLCEPWYFNNPSLDGLEPDKAIIYLPNGTILRCRLFAGTGAEHGLSALKPRYVEIYKGFGKFVTIVPKKVVLIDIGGSRTYTLRR